LGVTAAARSPEQRRGRAPAPSARIGIGLLAGSPAGLLVAVALRRGDRDLVDFINAWAVIQRSARALRAMRACWIVGFFAQPPRRRWLVMDAVLGWGAKPAARHCVFLLQEE
jgi:hypothetical protein